MIRGARMLVADRARLRRNWGWTLRAIVFYRVRAARSEACALFGCHDCAGRQKRGLQHVRPRSSPVLGYAELILSGHEELLGRELREDLDAVVGNHDLLLDSCC